MRPKPPAPKSPVSFHLLWVLPLPLLWCRNQEVCLTGKLCRMLMWPDSNAGHGIQRLLADLHARGTVCKALSSLDLDNLKHQPNDYFLMQFCHIVLRLVKSESSESLCSQSSGSSGTRPGIRTLRRHSCRSQSTTSTFTPTSSFSARGSTSGYRKRNFTK